MWLALTYDEHIHYAPATAWFEEAIDRATASNELAFCRVTEMGLLWLLTNPSVMGKDVRAMAGAWSALHAFYQDSKIRFAPEPSGLRDSWQGFSRYHQRGPNSWTDAYLSAFAARTGTRWLPSTGDSNAIWDFRCWCLANNNFISRPKFRPL